MVGKSRLHARAGLTHVSGGGLADAVMESLTTEGAVAGRDTSNPPQVSHQPPGTVAGKTKRVFHCAETALGGPATVIRQLASAQVAAGYDVHVLVPAEHMQGVDEIRGVKIHAFRREHRGLKALASLLIAFVRVVIRVRPDVVHLHSTFAGALCRPALLPLRGLVRARVIYSPHCWAFVSVQRSVVGALIRHVEAALARITDVIICGSTFEKSAILGNRPLETKCMVVMTAVDPPLRGPFLPKTDPEGRLQLTFVGRFDRQKGLDILLEAARLLDPEKFVIKVVGSLVRDAHRDLPELPHVRYLGWLDRRGVADVLSETSVVVMPSRWESFGLVAAEAFSYGIPVIATNCCSLPEIVEPGVSGWLVEPGDPARLASMLAGITIEDCQAFSPRCFEKYLASFTTEMMTSSCTGAYTAPLARSAGPRPRESRIHSWFQRAAP